MLTTWAVIRLNREVRRTLIDATTHEEEGAGSPSGGRIPIMDRSAGPTWHYELVTHVSVTILIEAQPDGRVDPVMLRLNEVFT